MSHNAKRALRKLKKRREARTFTPDAAWMTERFSVTLHKCYDAGDYKEVQGLQDALIDGVRILKPIPAGAHRAREVHRSIDYLMEVADAQAPDGFIEKISCRKGCNHCCYMHVGLSGDETELLVEEVERRGIALDMEKLERQSAFTAEDWMEHCFEDRRCPLLSDEGLCQVYENRPTACRTYRVMNDPADCDTRMPDDLRIQAINQIAVEAFASAAVTVCNEMDPNANYALPNRLFHAIQRRKAKSTKA